MSLIPQPRVSSGPVIAIAGAEFGWGSAGKLASIMEIICATSRLEPKFVLLNSVLGEVVLSGFDILTHVHAYHLRDDQLATLLEDLRVEVALVVLDSEIAIKLDKMQYKVVYVDSLPFLWTETDVVPTKVTAYLAQLASGLPIECWSTIRSIENLFWIDPIVSRSRSQSVGVVPRSALINFGGLKSPISNDSGRSYVRLTLQPLVDVLQILGYKEIRVAGNIDRRLIEECLDSVSSTIVTYGALDHNAFLREVEAAELVMTSPGRTALLELAQMNKPCVVLPPQNLSQIMNARDVRLAVESKIVVEWPPDLLNVQDVLDKRIGGEDLAVSFMYERLAEACDFKLSENQAELQERFLKAGENAMRSKYGIEAFLDPFGSEGAVQAAQHVLAVLNPAN